MLVRMGIVPSVLHLVLLLTMRWVNYATSAAHWLSIILVQRVLCSVLHNLPAATVTLCLLLTQEAEPMYIHTAQSLPK